MATRKFKGPSMESDFILNTDEARKKLEEFKKDAESPIKVQIEDPSLKNLQTAIQRTKKEAVTLGNELQKAINAGDKKVASTLDSLLSSKFRQIDRYETSFAQLQGKINAQVESLGKQSSQSSSGNVPTISKEMQEELNKLEEQKDQYKKVLDEIKKVSQMVASYENGDAISLPKGFKATEESAQKLIDRYYELNDRTNKGCFIII